VRRVALLFAVVLAGCSSKGIDALPPPPTTQPRPPTTAVVDLSGVALKEVSGKTTTTVAMGPGRAGLRGTVVGPDGPVPGATVQAERLVGDGAAVATVVTAADGTWALQGVLGGRFRVRAWRPTDLALTKPEVFFLNDGDTKPLQLVLTRYTGLAVTFAIAPNPPVVEEPANLVVQVVQQSVDPQGIVRGEPVPSVRVELFGGGDWSLTTTNPTFTDGQGRGRWQLRCRSEGKQQLAVVVGDTQQFPLDIAPCVVAPPPPEETTTTSSTPPGSSTTSSSSTTTTTQD
jgi:Carboxypeptidase regulatory-like domain